MNGIITHTHIKAPVQVHTGTQADREVDKRKHPSCQTSTQANTHTAYHQGLNLEQIRQGGEVKRGQSLVFVLPVCSVQQAASLWRTHTDDKAFAFGKINVTDSKIECSFTHIKRWLPACVKANGELKEFVAEMSCFAAPCFNLCQHTEHAITHRLAKGYSEGG